MKKPKIVYHFTSVLWLHFITRQGIYRGKCPVNRGLVLDHPNFTTDPDPANQGWAAGSVLNKRAVRIAIKIRHCDTHWSRWVDLAREHGASGEFIHALNESGGGGKNNWWIHKGIVLPSNFLSIETIGQPTPFDVNSLERAKRWRSQTYEEFRRNEIEEGYLEMVLDTRIRNSDRLIAVPTIKSLNEAFRDHPAA